jgi:hypothetical protein
MVDDCANMHLNILETLQKYLEKNKTKNGDVFRISVFLFLLLLLQGIFIALIIQFLVHFDTFILINIFRYVFPNSLIMRNFLLFISIWLSFLSLKV